MKAGTGLVFSVRHKWPIITYQSRTIYREIHDIDAKWLKKWESTPQYQQKNKTSQSPAYYQLPMFPYPSGRLHIGHLRVYAISDTLARFRRMKGYNVIHPIGWDAFGLPAENAAIENGIDAADWTYKHIDQMRNQLKRMLISFDWDREIITCHPDYYKHTQKIFLELYNAGLAYRRNATVNWDPVDKTVLANEQIDSLGRSWRSGAIAEKRDLEQWFLKITEYAECLKNDLELLNDWPDKVKRMQQQWIGLSAGVEVKFSDDLWAFTTKVETLPGVKFLAIAEDNPLAQKHAISTTHSGLVEGLEAMHPLTGEPLPVYVAPYIVSGYGSGIVMGVPAHDERDRLFWQEVRGKNANTNDFEPIIDYTSDDVVEKARKSVTETLKLQDKGREVTYTRIRDWLVSRQRFWGAPIPMVHCNSCGVVPVPESELPVKLPNDTKNVPLSHNKEWLETDCPKCGGPAHRDPDTMDTFMDSSWYFFRYLDPQNTKAPFDYEAASKKMPVNCYVGGVEHAILHLLYSRFLAKFLARTGKWDGGNLNGEPFRKLVTQGMVHGKTFRDKVTGRYLKPEELTFLKEQLKSDPSAMGNYVVSMEKMSKSKYNGVDPIDVIEMHGADATRAHMLFQAPIADTLDWDDEAIVGIERWLTKVSKLGAEFTPANADSVPQSGRAKQSPTNEEIALWNRASELNKSITESMSESLSLNTVISDYMKLTKCIFDLAKTNMGMAIQVYEVLLKLMAPVCPAHADELWEILQKYNGKEFSSIHNESWPELKAISEQKNGCQFKVLINSRPIREPLIAHADATEQELLAKLDIREKDIKRVIYKPKIKLLSIVTK